VLVVNFETVTDLALVNQWQAGNVFSSVFSRHGQIPIVAMAAWAKMPGNYILGAALTFGF
jgi:hypothetical protein